MSVVITTFNTARYLPETLASVFAQSYGNVEVIVVDDGSVDDTAAVARAYGDRITLVERPHEGLGPARNAGLALVTGSYVAFLDSDDVWEPDTLRTQVDVARRHPASGLIVGDGVQFGDASTGRLLGRAVARRVADAPGGELTGRMYREFLFENPARCPAQTLISRRAVDAVGTVCVTPVGPQDYDYYLRVAREFPVTVHSAQVARWRFRADSMSGPLATRGLHAVVQSLLVLEREATHCASDDQAVVQRAITRSVRRGCAAAARARLDHGVLPDPEAIATFRRLRPADPVVAGTRAVLALPDAVGRRVLGVARTARHTTRTARRWWPRVRWRSLRMG